MGGLPLPIQPGAFVASTKPDLNLWDYNFFARVDLPTSGKDLLAIELLTAANIAIRGKDQQIIIVTSEDECKRLFVSDPKSSIVPSQARFLLDTPNHREASNKSVRHFLNNLPLAIQHSIESVWSDPQSHMDKIKFPLKGNLTPLLACYAPELYLTASQYPQMFSSGFLCLGVCYEDLPPRIQFAPLIVRMDLVARWFVGNNHIAELEDHPRLGQPIPFFTPISSILASLPKKDQTITSLLGYMDDFKKHEIKSPPPAENIAEIAEKTEKHGPPLTGTSQIELPTSLLSKPPTFEPGELIPWQKIIEMEHARLNGKGPQDIPTSWTKVDFTGCDTDGKRRVKRFCMNAYHREYGKHFRVGARLNNK